MRETVENPSRDRPTDDDTVVTSEMIEMGEKAMLEATKAAGLGTPLAPRDLVVSVYRAMESRRFPRFLTNHHHHREDSSPYTPTEEDWKKMLAELRCWDRRFDGPEAILASLLEVLHVPTMPR
jgi:hypothetical protein